MGALAAIRRTSTALSIVREKERGTVEQVRMAPLGPFAFVLGKTIPYFVIAFASAMGIVFVAMVGSCVASGISGALVPMGLKRLGADPATASSIFLTTATDGGNPTCSAQDFAIAGQPLPTTTSFPPALTKSSACGRNSAASSRQRAQP